MTTLPDRMGLISMVRKGVVVENCRCMAERALEMVVVVETGKHKEVKVLVMVEEEERV